MSIKAHLWWYLWQLHELFLIFPTCIHTLCISCLHSVSLQTVPAGIDVALAYRASEEAFAAITAGGSIVFPCGFISTDCTVTNDPIWTRQAWLCRHAVWSTKKKQNKTHTGKYKCICIMHTSFFQKWFTLCILWWWWRFWHFGPQSPITMWWYERP